MNAAWEPLLSRIPAAYANLRAAATACFEVEERFRAHERKVEADQTLTPLGRQKALADAAVKEFLPNLDIAQRPIAAAALRNKEAREKFAIPAPDRTDLVTALEHQEIRTMLRSMRPAERMALLINTRDERMVDAVISAPIILTGLNEAALIEVRNAAIKRRFADAVSQIEADENAVAEADNARSVVLSRIQDVAKVTDRQMKAILRKGIERPWLKRDGDEIMRIIPGEGAAKANADDIALGKFFASYDAYLAENPGAVDLRKQPAPGVTADALEEIA